VLLLLQVDALEGGVREMESLEDDVASMQRSYRLFQAKKLRMTIDQAATNAAAEAARLQALVDEASIAAASYRAEASAVDEDARPLREDLASVAGALEGLQLQLDAVAAERDAVLARAPLLAKRVAQGSGAAAGAAAASTR